MKYINSTTVLSMVPYTLQMLSNYLLGKKPNIICMANNQTVDNWPSIGDSIGNRNAH